MQQSRSTPTPTSSTTAPTTSASATAQDEFDDESLYGNQHMVEQASLARSSGQTFSDVSTDPNDWVHQVAEQASALGLVQGYEDGTFRASNDVTQGEFVTMILRTAGIEPEWDEVMDWARKFGAAIDDERDRPINRGEAAFIICEIIGVQPVEGTKFSDSGTSRYGGYLEVLGAQGIFSGDAGATTVRPDDTLNRAEAAALAVRVDGVSLVTPTAPTEETGEETTPVPVPSSQTTTSQTTTSSTTNTRITLEDVSHILGVNQQVIDAYYAYADLNAMPVNQDLKTIYTSTTTIQSTLKKAGDIKVAANAVMQLSPESSPIGALQAFSDLYNSVIDLMPVPPGIDAFLESYGDILAEIASRLETIAGECWTSIKKLLDSGDVSTLTDLRDWIGSYRMSLPGGEDLLDYTIATFASSTPVAMDDYPEARGWIEDNASTLQFVTGEAPPMESYMLFWEQVDESSAPGWFHRHRDELKSWVYGDKVSAT